MKKYSRVYLEITNMCNRSCSFCPGTSRAPRRLALQEMELLCKKLRPYTDYLYLHLMGEPLTHPELGLLIGAAQNEGFKVAITTNGTLLPMRGEELIKLGVYKVNVSLHSFEHGSREEQLKYINECIDFADRASRAGVLTVLRLWNRGRDEGRNIDTVATLRERFAEGEWREDARGARIRHGLHLEYGERFAWPSMVIEPISDEVFCYGLCDHFGILSDGTVVPCCLDGNAAIPLGNALTEELADILSSERAQKIREGFSCKRAVEELCKRCGYARRFKL